jgi:hypothetical protein
MGNYLFLLILLACPLMMMWMMRGGHGGHADHTHGAGGCHNGHDDVDAKTETSLDDLRLQRDELDDEIAKREVEEQTYAGSGRR